MTVYRYLASIFLLVIFVVVAFAEEQIAEVKQPQEGATPSVGSQPLDDDSGAEVAEDATPWDYDPYKVLIWYVNDDDSVDFASLQKQIQAVLDRDFQAVWRVDYAVAPSSVATAAKRGMSSLTYDLITAADPVIAVRRDHPDAVRIRVAKNISDYVPKVYSTEDRAEEVMRKAIAIGNDDFDGIKEKLEIISGDEFAVRELWNETETDALSTENAGTDSSNSEGVAGSDSSKAEAILVSRGIANTLNPEAKLIVPRISDLVGEIIENYDKVFIVSVVNQRSPTEVEVVEFDTLMRHFGPVAKVKSFNRSFLPRAVALGLTKAFGPMVRIENAGQRSALGLVRAGGLVREKDRESSPAWIRVGDVLEPMTRKNDRNGDPIMIGPLDWAYLHVTELDGHNDRNVQMDFYSGRGGGLQGRKNKRTFKTALKVRPQLDSTEMRLHLQRDPGFPLIGYELYQKDLESGDMTFVGRTNWNGLLVVEPSDERLRLMYVKNGGAILARLPIVPGLYPRVVADLSGDDIRLQAEAYIRGAQNSIIDLVAIRELFKARILLRLERGEMEKAEELLTALRDQPTSEGLYGAIGKKQQEFINLLGTKNANQSRKVDEMFSNTRDLLQKHITPKLVQDLELDYIEAQKNGGKLPPRDKQPKVDNSADGESDTSKDEGKSTSE
ncbi:MAG: hypothetical protein ISQ09_03485 [Rubripirellula sp.]|nr:hypothetical protein [Rubripirellula sp.]